MKNQSQVRHGEEVVYRGKNVHHDEAAVCCGENVHHGEATVRRDEEEVD